MITSYPQHRKVDNVLKALGEDFHHDDTHDLYNRQNDAEVAEGDEDGSSSSSDEDDGGDDNDDPGGHVDAAVADCSESASMESVPLSAPQAEAVHHMHSTIAALESTM